MTARHVKGRTRDTSPGLTAGFPPEWGAVTTEPWTPPAVEYATNEPYPRDVLTPDGYATGWSQHNPDAPHAPEWAKS